MPSEGGGAQKKGIISGGRVDARVACQRSVKSARVHAKVDKKEERDSEGAGNRCSRTARRRVAMLPVEAPCAPRERSLGKRNPVVVVPQKKTSPGRPHRSSSPSRSPFSDEQQGILAGRRAHHHTKKKKEFFKKKRVWACRRPPAPSQFCFLEKKKKGQQRHGGTVATATTMDDPVLGRALRGSGSGAHRNDNNDGDAFGRCRAGNGNDENSGGAGARRHGATGQPPSSRAHQRGAVAAAVGRHRPRAGRCPHLAHPHALGVAQGPVHGRQRLRGPVSAGRCAVRVTVQPRPLRASARLMHATGPGLVPVAARLHRHAYRGVRSARRRARPACGTPITPPPPITPPITPPPVAPALPPVAPHGMLGQQQQQQVPLPLPAWSPNTAGAPGGAGVPVSPVPVAPPRRPTT